MNSPEDAIGPRRMLGTDHVSRVGHALIRAGMRDDLDPYLVRGHPAWPDDGSVVLACHWYAVVITPTATIGFSNHGAGGMCDLVEGEIVAMWSTRDVLDRLGMTLEDLREGRGGDASVPDMPAPDDALRDAFLEVCDAHRRRKVEAAVEAALDLPSP